MNYFLHRTILGNTVEDILWFIGIILAGLIFQRLISRLLTLFVFKFLQKYSTGVGFEKLLALLKRPMGIFIVLLSIYIAFQHLHFPASWNMASIDKFGLRMVMYRLFQIAIIISITWMVLRITDFFGLVLSYRASLTESKSDDQLVPFFKESIKVIIIILSVFFILGAVFKLNIASLVAGLGIGGLAIALAGKESLENLFGSFTIFLDKPFIIGDHIKTGAVEGNVEKIGFRSTRLRTPDKSFVTVPNKKLVDSELDNLSLRTHRRASFDIGVTYDTKPEQIKNIIAELQNYIDTHNHTVKGETRVRMYSFGDSSINIKVVYLVDTMEYDVYLNVRQEINYEIMDIISRNGSSFAYPTRTLFMKAESAAADRS
jgi:MscS family membrane protein